MFLVCTFIHQIHEFSPSKISRYMVYYHYIRNPLILLFLPLHVQCSQHTTTDKDITIVLQLFFNNIVNLVHTQKKKLVSVLEICSFYTLPSKPGSSNVYYVVLKKQQLALLIQSKYDFYCNRLRADHPSKVPGWSK